MGPAALVAPHRSPDQRVEEAVQGARHVVLHPRELGAHGRLDVDHDRQAEQGRGQELDVGPDQAPLVEVGRDLGQRVLARREFGER